MLTSLARSFTEALERAGITFVAFLPESRLSDMVPLLLDDDAFKVIRATHEGSAASIAAGAALVGEGAAVYTEATGLMASLYNLQCVAMSARVPLLLIVSHIGSLSDTGNNGTFFPWGEKTEPLLRAMRIPYRVLEDGRDLERKVEDMVRAAHAGKTPVCLLLTGDFTRSDEDAT